MISFTIITSTPAVLRNQLVARDVIKEITITDPNGSTRTKLIGVRQGLEWIEVANPIKASGTGTPADPYVPDSRHCYLVKLVRAAEANEIDGLIQSDPNESGGFTLRSLLERTKLGQWILANSVVDTLTSADGRSWPSRRVGTNFWSVISDDFGVWQ